jgi:glucose/arabinose dehydrogenase
MIKNIYLFLCLLFLYGILKAQPGSVNMTPVQSLGLVPVQVEVPAAFKSTMSGSYTVYLPAGYKATIFYAGGLNKPRFLAFNSAGVLHVSDMFTNNNGRIYALPDADGNGVADSARVAATGFVNNHDVKFYNGQMYVTEEQKVWKLTDANSDGIFESRSIFIDSIGWRAAQPVGGHRTRSIVFDAEQKKVYVSIGSLCNVCREDYRAVIEQYDENGKNGRVFASGVRNAVGMAVHPQTGRLWANNNGSDRQGDFIPPEWIDIIRDQGFYGYPFAYANQVWFNFDAHSDYAALKPIVAADSVKVIKMIEPAALIQAHTAPMALTFLNNTFPIAMRNGMLSALRGSWNTPQNYKGYKLVYLDLSSATDTTVNYVADFCTGFITDTINRVYWGRPVGLAIAPNGDIYMSSDESNRFIMRIYRDGPTGLSPNLEMPKQLMVYPNPASTQLFINCAQAPSLIEVFNAQGKVVFQSKGSIKNVDVENWPRGVYFVHATINQTIVTNKVVLW